MNRSLWKSTLTKTWCPKWPCPECGRGALKLKEKPIQQYKTVQSRTAEHEVDVRDRFACALECDHCEDPIVVLGNVFLEEEPVDNEGSFEWMPHFMPLFFNPPLMIINVSRLCTKPIRNELILAFALYWCNQGAAANRIRSAVELLLDHLTGC
jgi:hypothetical protein